MTTLLRDRIGRAQVEWLGARLEAVSKDFQRLTFVDAATTGLDSLELKARARHVADALETVLPASATDAFDLLVRAMEAPRPEDEREWSGFQYLPVSEYLERHGLRHVETALRANEVLTRRFTSEFCIRPLIQEAWEPTRRTFERWVVDPSEHVRRLVSEGTRPLLPWGRRLPAFVRDPSPILPLLELLRDDESPYVRRSVANNLNDISKHHPQVTLDVARRWLEGASPERRRLVEHALRTLLKRGDARALALLGARGASTLASSGRLEPSQVRIGDTVRLGCTVRNHGSDTLHVVAEARVHFVRPSGRASIRPFRLGRADLAPGGVVDFDKNLPMVHRSIRRLHPGEHLVELQVNGERTPMGGFTLAV